VGGAVVDVAFAVLGVNTGGAFTKVGIESGKAAFSVGFETEADYVGLYIVALAGYNFAEAPNLWRRMAVLNPASIDHSKSHPSAPERFVALEGGVKEIQEKKARKQPLRPNFKPKPESIPESDRATR
jgi:predicted Zn-dependent protease